MQIFETAIRASIEAGKIILGYYEGQDYSLESKADDSPLTTADTMANAHIVDQLNDTGIPILSEEGKEIPYKTRKKWEKFWLVDPLDGTKEFINRNGEFTVNIALVEKDKPEYGVVYVPVKDVLYFGGGDFGTFKLSNAKANFKLSFPEILLNSQKLEKKPCLDKEIRIVASKSHLSKETQDFIDEQHNFFDKVEIISVGSSLKFCIIAEGLADLYPRLGPTMEWDTAAAHAVLKGVGIEVYEFETKKPLIYNKENLMNPNFIVKR